MEKNFDEMFSQELILVDYEARDRESLLRELGGYLLRQGYVRESFPEALVARERSYPTGLPTAGVKVALPHVDTAHARRPGILMATLKRPLPFKEMGDGVRELPVEMVFVIVVTDPEEEVRVLQRLMRLFSREEVLARLRAAGSAGEAYHILKGEIRA